MLIITTITTTTTTTTTWANCWESLKWSGLGSHSLYQSSIVATRELYVRLKALRQRCTSFFKLWLNLSLITKWYYSGGQWKSTGKFNQTSATSELIKSNRCVVKSQKSHSNSNDIGSGAETCGIDLNRYDNIAKKRSLLKFHFVWLISLINAINIYRLRNWHSTPDFNRGRYTPLEIDNVPPDYRRNLWNSRVGSKTWITNFVWWMRLMKYNSTENERGRKSGRKKWCVSFSPINNGLYAKSRKLYAI